MGGSGGILGLASDILVGDQEETEVTSNEYEDILAQIATDWYESTGPMRESLISDLTAAAEGRFNPELDPMYASLFSQQKAGIEGQYGLAKENILASVPRGGGLTKALTDLEISRAGAAASMPQEVSLGIINNMLNQAYGTGMNLSPSTSALGTAASSLSNRQAMAMQADAAKYGAKKQATGQMVGGGAAGLGYAMGS